MRAKPDYAPASGGCGSGLCVIRFSPHEKMGQNSEENSELLVSFHFAPPEPVAGLFDMNQCGMTRVTPRFL